MFSFIVVVLAMVLSIYIIKRSRQEIKGCCFDYAVVLTELFTRGTWLKVKRDFKKSGADFKDGTVYAWYGLEPAVQWIILPFKMLGWLVIAPFWFIFYGLRR